MFEKVESKVDLVKLEEKILDFWKKNKIFQKTLEETKGKKRFIFYEGPPTANGAPGVHHVLSRVFKDVFPRYKTMNGYYVKRKAGWDTHGLPVELEIEKKLNINSKKEIEDFGIAKFNKLCKESVMQYEEEWKKMTERIGFWLDLDDAYFTFKNEYIETIWWILKKIWEKDLLYEGYKIVPYCPRCGTALSSHEVALGYKEIKDINIIVSFDLKTEKDTSILVWTTTPWTLVSNVACAVQPDAEYSKILYKKRKYIMVSDLVDDLFKDEEYELLEKIPGKDLVDTEYKPLFDYAPKGHDYRIIAGSFVSTEEGTGIVHIAPAFGEDDMKVGRKNKLPVVQMVDEEGKFKSEVEGYAEIDIEEANDMIVEDLKTKGKVLTKQREKHSYPFCWRCDKRLIYYSKKSWYINTSKIKQELLNANDKVNWFPEHIKHGRFGKWLENNIDWALTRERYWGTPLPIWRDKNGHIEIIGSIEELIEKGENVDDDIDLHRPYVDKIVIRCDKCGEMMKRVEGVIDVWFDSGSMPFSQYHYPFENKEIFRESFPADFICEAIDQTRGWFYTMLTISTLLFGRSSYKNVLCLGLINDEKGQKMSKSKGNVIRPWDILNNQGADALRWYFFTGVSPWLPKNFSAKAIDEIIRQFILTLWNTYSFFIIYANIDDFNPLDHELEISKRTEIDKWIISELNKTIKEVNKLMDDFNVTDSGRLIQKFVDDLSNWYVRRSRRRFWKSEEDIDKISAYKTLYECLLLLSKLLAPYIPFISEAIYKNLTGSLDTGFESVHLESYPKPDDKLIDDGLNYDMEIARDVVGLGRAVRSRLNIKTRQPLGVVKIFVDKDKKKESACNRFEDIILEELNVKKLEVINRVEDLMSYDVKPNLRLIGPKYGKLVPDIREKLNSSNPISIALKIKNNKDINLMIKGKQVTLKPEEVLVEGKDNPDYGAESDGEITVGLPIHISKELKDEGFARELVHQIQNLRKKAGFEIENKIDTFIDCSSTEKEIITKFSDYIKKETLTEEFYFKTDDAQYIDDIRINGQTLKIGLTVVGNI